ncbi:hypothetical protein SARC_03490 [Sphaeroforma arctica JP610]|uniref:Uncharacterized protein n=1 Tax=Sphaeroforma arctica JP610 TaxID=667725 RepID=A0A0L0G5R0_9EUKA|nr:hypothetical protein SARC_03490 [Sphaeroforma arctica JP610]KNC84289.1 hypothetical protein SARC_03490 [Sphaeroforma arctica JP610]|eukprot:XP_014158191.1 hypothetical protein SARC_03490 [Sphaeroforma arctica JP610]
MLPLNTTGASGSISKGMDSAHVTSQCSTYRVESLHLLLSPVLDLRGQPTEAEIFTTEHTILSAGGDFEEINKKLGITGTEVAVRQTIGAFLVKKGWTAAYKDTVTQRLRIECATAMALFRRLGELSVLQMQQLSPARNISYAAEEAQLEWNPIPAHSLAFQSRTLDCTKCLEKRHETSSEPSESASSDGSAPTMPPSLFNTDNLPNSWSSVLRTNSNSEQEASVTSKCAQSCTSVSASPCSASQYSHGSDRNSESIVMAEGSTVKAKTPLWPGCQEKAQSTARTASKSKTGSVRPGEARIVRTPSPNHAATEQLIVNKAARVAFSRMHTHQDSSGEEWDDLPDSGTLGTMAVPSLFGNKRRRVLTDVFEDGVVRSRTQNSPASGKRFGTAVERRLEENSVSDVKAIETSVLEHGSSRLACGESASRNSRSRAPLEADISSQTTVVDLCYQDGDGLIWNGNESGTSSCTTVASGNNQQNVCSSISSPHSVCVVEYNPESPDALSHAACQGHSRGGSKREVRGRKPIEGMIGGESGDVCRTEGSDDAQAVSDNSSEGGQSRYSNVGVVGKAHTKSLTLERIDSRQHTKPKEIYTGPAQTMSSKPRCPTQPSRSSTALPTAMNHCDSGVHSFHNTIDDSAKDLSLQNITDQLPPQRDCSDKGKLLSRYHDDDERPLPHTGSSLPTSQRTRNRQVVHGDRAHTSLRTRSQPAAPRYGLTGSDDALKASMAEILGETSSKEYIAANSRQKRSIQGATGFQSHEITRSDREQQASTATILGDSHVYCSTQDKPLTRSIAEISAMKPSQPTTTATMVHGAPVSPAAIRAAPFNRPTQRSKAVGDTVVNSDTTSVLFEATKQRSKGLGMGKGMVGGKKSGKESQMSEIDTFMMLRGQPPGLSAHTLFGPTCFEGAMKNSFVSDDQRYAS